MCDNVFDNILPKFLNHVEPLLANGQYLFGENITTADFWIGGLYTNFIANPDVGFAKERW
jgi:glutathione S-transferase